MFYCRLLPISIISIENCTIFPKKERASKHARNACEKASVN
jgi:hypothetical protein